MPGIYMCLYLYYYRDNILIHSYRLIILLFSYLASHSLQIEVGICDGLSYEQVKVRFPEG